MVVLELVGVAAGMAGRLMPSRDPCSFEDMGEYIYRVYMRNWSGHEVVQVFRTVTDLQEPDPVVAAARKWGWLRWYYMQWVYVPGN